MKLFIGIIIAVILLSACEKDQIGRYDLDRYLHFTVKETVDTTLSFSHYPESEILEIPFEINLTGSVSTEDLKLQLWIVDSLTTALPGQYEVNLTPVFRKGHVKDTIKLILKKVNLTDNVTLAVGLVANENFQLGFVGQRQVKIAYNNLASKPLWWNSTINLYLGTYSAKKFEEFVKFKGINDLSGVEEYLVRQYAKEFKKHVQDTGITEEDGSPMIIPAY